MSKKIDFSAPLSDEDEAYLAERPWLRTDAELSGFDLSDETDFSVDEDEDDENPDGFDDGGDDGSEGDADDSDEDESDEEDEGEGDEDEVAPYAEWEYAALKEEAGSRNLSKSGSKEQLIERLEQDDASAQE
jgi:hypothetical protein